MNYTKSIASQNYQNELGIVNPETMSHSNTVIPTLDVRQRFSVICKNATSTATGSTTIYTPDSDKDFYVTAVTLSVMKDAANDNTSVDIRCKVDGATIALLAMNFLTTTAAILSQTLTLAHPLKIDRASNPIQLSGSFAAGTMAKRAIIYGFYA